MSEVLTFARRGAVNSTGCEYLQAARSMRALLATEAAATDKLGTLSPGAVEMFRDAGFFWMCVGAELGGGGCTITQAIAVVEEIASVDASVAWSLMANLSETALAVAYLGDDAIDAMFGGPRKAIVAGMFGAGGKGVPVRGGLQAAGRYGFGSGMAHADWIGSGMLVTEDGKPRPLPSGAPEIQVCLIPIGKIDMTRNWPATGLIGTGSYDYSVPEQFVAGDFMFERNINRPKRGSSLFNLGMIPMGASGHCGVVMGLARHALSEMAELAAVKKRPGAARVIALDEVFREGFAMQEATYQGARDYTYRAYREAKEQALAGLPITPEHIARVRQVTIWLHQMASQIVRFCHLWAGSEAIRNFTAMSRVSRDMAVASQHILADPAAMASVAGPILDGWRSA